MTMAELFKHFGLEAGTIDFIGHALALHTSDAYLTMPAKPTVLKASFRVLAFRVSNPNPIFRIQGV